MELSMSTEKSLARRDVYKAYLAAQTEERHIWWNDIPARFRENIDYCVLKDWSLSLQALQLKSVYVNRFNEEIVEKRIPENNWKRADICYHLVPDNASILDIGSGLGEFTNLCSLNNQGSIASVDIKDYSLWFDAAGRIERIYRSIFDLDYSDGRDVVTCFEVIEHLPPERLREAVLILRRLARKKLFISVPFMESFPLYRGHFTRFDADLLKELFPDGHFTVFDKGGRRKPICWILVEIEV
jgi:SAM-dependent methyltransferase